MKAFVVCIAGFPLWTAVAQDSLPALKGSKLSPQVAAYIRDLDTLVHLETWGGRNEMAYRFDYPGNFRLLLKPNVMNTLNLGVIYRFVDVSFGFTPAFLNAPQLNNKKGNTSHQSLATGFSVNRYYLRLEYFQTKGFYLGNSNELGAGTPASPYLLFPGFRSRMYSILLRYNTNKRFSTAALKAGTQVQLRSAWTLLPALQVAHFIFRDEEDVNTGVENQQALSTDFNLIVPALATWVPFRDMAITAGGGPTIGFDVFQSQSYTNTRQLKGSGGTSISTGYYAEAAMGYNRPKWYAGADVSFRAYGHNADLDERMQKRQFYVLVYVGWRFAAPRWARHTMDWINKKSPVKFE